MPVIHQQSDDPDATRKDFMHALALAFLLAPTYSLAEADLERLLGDATDHFGDDEDDILAAFPETSACYYLGEGA